MTDVSLGGAFLAGLVSFLSPCVLPLVPGYISMLSGIGMEQLRRGEAPRSGLFASSLAFVCGFSLVFVSFGATASAVGVFLKQNRAYLTPVARWLNRDVHLRSAGSQAGPWSGFLLGFAFAFGWTPCIGPILTTVLAMAAAADHVARGVLLLATYSAGLAVPFLLTALGIGQFLTFYQRFRKYLHAVEVFSGTLLLFIGGLIFFNSLTWLTGKLSFLSSIVLWLEHAVTSPVGARIFVFLVVAAFAIFGYRILRRQGAPSSVSGKKVIFVVATVIALIAATYAADKATRQRNRSGSRRWTSR